MLLRSISMFCKKSYFIFIFNFVVLTKRQNNTEYGWTMKENGQKMSGYFKICTCNNDMCTCVWMYNCTYFHVVTVSSNMTLQYYLYLYFCFWFLGARGTQFICCISITLLAFLSIFCAINFNDNNTYRLL